MHRPIEFVVYLYLDLCMYAMLSSQDCHDRAQACNKMKSEKHSVCLFGS